MSTWATNQLVRHNEIDVQRLLKAGDQLRATQLEAAAAQEPRAFREARVEERNAIDRLVRAASTILTSAGHAASDATLNRVATNLRTGAVTEDGRQLLKRGRLAEDFGAAGFEAFAGMALPPPPARKPKAAREPAAKKEANGHRESARERKRATARAKLEQAQEEAAGLANEAAAAEEAVEAVRRELERTEREAKGLRGRAARAAERVDKAERELERIQ